MQDISLYHSNSQYKHFLIKLILNFYKAQTSEKQHNVDSNLHRSQVRQNILNTEKIKGYIEIQYLWLDILFFEPSELFSTQPC